MVFIHLWLHIYRNRIKIISLTITNLRFLRFFLTGIYFWPYICTIYVLLYLFRIVMSISSNPKYLQILHTGRKLFWKFGFKRVSIEEICKEAGVSKMTFYKHFPNKLELLKVVFDEIFEQALEKFSVLEDKSIAADDKLKLIISLKSSGISGTERCDASRYWRTHIRK